MKERIEILERYMQEFNRRGSYMVIRKVWKFSEKVINELSEYKWSDLGGRREWVLTGFSHSSML